MNLYLSSYRLGNETEKLKVMFNGPRVGVIRNSLDFSNENERLEQGRQREFADLEGLGLSPEDLDLRTYFGREDELRQRLLTLNGVWVVGGNSFILRRAMKYSGMDNILIGSELGNNFTYAGYSAGICVLSPSLRGIELVDPPEVIPDGYEASVIWDGLNIVPYAFAPHYESNHPESKLINEVVSFYEHEEIEHITLKDGEVFISTYHGSDT